MTAAWLVAVDEWRQMRRNRVALLGLVMLLLLSAASALTSIAQRNASDAIRARFQAQADQAFDGAPARHPHRMVHYGHFVFRPLPALAGFDPGVDAFTGNAIYLEGHRQNSANFGDIRQSSLLIRFGALTPAFVLQVFAPLMLIFLGFGCVVRERERGTLSLLLAHGVTARELLSGKVIGLGGFAMLLLLPAMVALGWLASANGASIPATLFLLLGYTTYLLFWTLLIVVVSAVVANARTVLLVLICLWAVTAILLPRAAPDVALASNPVLTRLETDIAIQDDLRKMGDSHDAADPYFSDFKARTLARYGVSKVEDLPVNYSGLLAAEGEKLTSGLFDDYADRLHNAQSAQNRLRDRFGLLSPTIALQRLSMSTAGTDLEGHRRFLAQAESYRFTVVQQLNNLQATALTYADDRNRNKDPEAGKRVRISPENWKNIPDFEYGPASVSDKIRQALPGLVILLGWAVVLVGSLLFAARRLKVTAQ